MAERGSETAVFDENARQRLIQLREQADRAGATSDQGLTDGLVAPAAIFALVAFFLWQSLLSFLLGFAAGFAVLVLIRVLVAVNEASLTS